MAIDESVLDKISQNSPSGIVHSQMQYFDLCSSQPVRVRGEKNLAGSLLRTTR